MVTDAFRRISNWPKTAPVVDVEFEIFNSDEKSHGIYLKPFLFDTGNEGGGGDNAVEFIHTGVRVGCR